MLVQGALNTHQLDYLYKRISQVIANTPNVDPSKADVIALNDTSALNLNNALEAMSYLLKKAESISGSMDVTLIMKVLGHLVSDFDIREDGQDIEKPLITAYSFIGGTVQTLYVPVNKILWIEKEPVQIHNGYSIAKAYCVLNDGKHTKFSLSSKSAVLPEIIAELHIKAALEVVARWQQR